MRRGLFGALMIVGLLNAGGTSAPAATRFEDQVIAALNAARADPAGYAAQLQRYRTYFQGNLLRYPGQPADLETDEGVAAFDDAIAFLQRQAPLRPVESAPLLAATAADLASDQAQGGVGHQSSDNALPADRARRRGGGSYVAEVIAYGPMDADDVVRQLIIDDGVSDRGHRSILYMRDLRFAGAACGPHPDYRTVCVIDLSRWADARPR